MSDGMPSPERISKIGYGFMASKTLLSAVELGVFTELADGPQTREELEERLDIHPRSSADFLDALVALGLLEREDGRYRNAPDADTYLDRNKRTYIGGQFEYASERMYPLFDELTGTLRTGEPQSQAGQEDYFETLYEDEERLATFAEGMTGMSAGVAETLASVFEWAEYESMCDVGASKGIVPVTVAMQNDHIEATAFDLPPVQPLAEEFIARSGMGDRVSFHPGDAFEQPLPEHEVFVLGRILHDFNMDRKRTLIERTYEALPEGGALIVYGSMIDNERRENASALVTSLYTRVENDGFDYTPDECQEWLEAAGFADTEVRDLPGPETMVVAHR